jgi:hypothetical protein
LLAVPNRVGADKLDLQRELLRQRRLRRVKQRSVQQSRTNAPNCSLNRPHLTLPKRVPPMRSPRISVRVVRPAKKLGRFDEV